MAEFEPVISPDDPGDQIKADTLVVGGGIVIGFSRAGPSSNPPHI